MLGLVVVFGGVLVFGGIAATYMTADHAEPQVHPLIAHLEAFLTAAFVSVLVDNLVDVPAFVGHVSSYSQITIALRTEREPRSLRRRMFHL